MLSTPDMVLKLEFEGDYVDSSGKGHNGVNVATTFTTGQFGKGIVTGASNKRVSVADNNDFSFTDGTNDLPFTIAFNFKPTGSLNYILAKYTSGTSGEWAITHVATNKLRVFCASNNGAPYKGIVSYDAVLETNVMKHYAFTFDGQGAPSGLTMNMYVDGVAQAKVDVVSGSYVKMSNGLSAVSVGSLSGGAQVASEFSIMFCFSKIKHYHSRI